LVVAICALVVITEGYDLIVFGALLPKLLVEPGWGLNSASAGTIGSFVYLGMLIGALTGGPACDRFGRRRFVNLAVAWFTMWTFACALAAQPWQLGAFRLLAGMGMGAVIPAAVALAKEYTPPSRGGLAVTILMAGIPLGGMAASAIGLVVLPAHGWRPMFLIGGLTIVAAAGVLTVAMRRIVLRPLTQLSAAARRVGGGDFDARAPVSSSDEIGQLGAAFNDMTARLTTARQELEGKNSELATALQHLQESRERLELLEQLKGELAKFVPEAVQRLLDARIEPVLLSGEARDTCETIGRALDIEHVRPEVLPADRGAEVRALAEGGSVVAVVGHPSGDDGALGAADVAVAMGAAGATPGEWAVALASDDVRDAALALAIPHATRARVRAAIALGATPGVIALLAIGFGIAPLAIAPLAALAGAVAAAAHARESGARTTAS